MKTLGAFVGVIVLLVIIVFCFALFNNHQEEKKALAATELEKKSLDYMVSSEEKMQESQKLLSQKSISLDDQTKALKLIEESISEAKKAAASQPDKPQTWYYLSEAYQKLRDVNPKNAVLAEEALNHAIELAPKNDTYLSKRATVLIFQDKFQEAERDIQAALKIAPAKANHYFKLGNIYKSLGKDDEAKKAYLLAKKLTPTENKMGMAQIEFQLKDMEKKETNKPTPKVSIGNSKK